MLKGGNRPVVENGKERPISLTYSMEKTGNDKYSPSFSRVICVIIVYLECEYSIASAPANTVECINEALGFPT